MSTKPGQVQARCRDPRAARPRLRRGQSAAAYAVERRHPRLVTDHARPPEPAVSRRRGNHLVATPTTSILTIAECDIAVWQLPRDSVAGTGGRRFTLQAGALKMRRGEALRMAVFCIATGTACIVPSEPKNSSASGDHQISLLEVPCDENPTSSECNAPPPPPPPSSSPCASRMTSAGMVSASPTPHSSDTFPVEIEGVFDLSGCSGPAVYRIVGHPYLGTELSVAWFVAECRETINSDCNSSSYRFAFRASGNDDLLLTPTDGLSGSTGVFSRYVYAVVRHQTSGRESVSGIFWSRDMSNLFGASAAYRLCNPTAPPFTTYAGPGPLERRLPDGRIQLFSRNICSGARENISHRLGRS